MQIPVDKKRPLDLESRVGDNVQRKPRQPEIDSSQKIASQTKRRRIISPNSSEGSVVELSNYEVRGTARTLTWEVTYINQNYEKCQERNSSLKSAIDADLSNSDTQGRQPVQNMMNSNPKPKSRGRHRKSSNRQSFAKAPGPQVRLDSTELSDELAREKDDHTVPPDSTMQLLDSPRSIRPR